MFASDTKKRFLIILIFGIAMGFMEAVIVVYLRELYFPGGFGFPLTMPENDTVIIAELVREITTVIMLVCLAWLAGKSFLQRFAWFLYSFAVWDIFYYAGLKVFLGWPDSLLTWDVLYLIPVTWVGPVLAPLISSLLMILLAAVFLLADRKNLTVKPSAWTLIYAGAFIIFLTFIWDFSGLIIKNNQPLLSLPESREYIALVSTYVPQYYNWPMFSVGAALIVLALILVIRSVKRV